MKKLISVFTAALMMVGFLSACNSTSVPNSKEKSNENVTTESSTETLDNTSSSETETNSESSDSLDSSDKKKLQIVTTIFPEYDWVKNVLGGNPADAEVTMLLDNGVDLHSFQPTAEDIMKISSCDMFIYVGGESDEWVTDALQEATNYDQ
ncbi:metal ABC transporter substrate-binding protein [Oribacterium sp. WCC10]|uniref:metal ABC transporter substrate-binding protein n=1 Tax=Oribacterium sp. WCC10 TaxID=1855343 RepID=UPI0008E975C6|nr:metal ABC transporter substrate-binding protein [Oribacterium sp. WCC10]SFG67141.1 zinc transport system substrate-binding protein [Oribacterium sp. WCC10]